MALYHKYRPQTFKDLLGQDHVSQTLRNALKANNISHGYLFSGPRGSGKTTTARLLAKALNCLEIKDGELCNNHCVNCIAISQGKALDILEIDAASNRGIDDIRELREHVKFAPNNLKYKVVIIDEVHMLTKEAFNALLKTLEEPPSHVVFILATTEAHKVQATILSRVQRFNFKRAPVEMLAQNLLDIAKKEKIKLAKDGATLLGSLSEGSFRDSVTLLDQVSGQDDQAEIDSASIRQILGLSNDELTQSFFEAIEENDRNKALDIIDTLLNEGGDPGNFLNQALLHVRNLLRKSEDPRILKWLEGLLKATEQLKVSPLPSLPIEIFIVEQTRPKISDIKPPARPIESSHQEPIEKEKVIDIQIVENKEDTKLNIEEVDIELSVNEEEKIKESNINSILPHSESKPKKVTTNPIKFSESDWHKLVNELKKENTTLAAILKDGYIDEVVDNQLRIVVKFKFHASKLGERKNQTVLENLLEEMVGQPMSVTCIVNPDSDKFKPKKITQSIDLVSDAINVFEGI